YPSKPDNPGE
nr:Chain E, Neuropeptide Y [synthetic construct]1R9N_F Chain F, Neuropeptide Y [synthetic construct]1R9N_G Chain G, Neuropeptide Y [synthetic construct]1R9N_H Chain H, Neuropeptide Y [synthetic construct]